MNAIADTILAQLGGGRIFAMAFDAKRSSYAPNTLKLAIAKPLVRGTKEHATHVIIRLEASDTYTVEIHRVEKPTSRRESAVVAYREMVYAEDLRRLIEAETGLALSL